MKKLNRVYGKIKKDRKEFKENMLTAGAEGVYASAYEICTVEEIYNILNTQRRRKINNTL